MKNESKTIAIIGGGPTGLMAAERLAGFYPAATICVYEHKPSLGRKFLMAGRGGLNLTHSEPLDSFLTRYREAQDWLAPMLHQFTPDDLRGWCEGLGQETFVGSSGRVFPKAMKASPLLRAWTARLQQLGVTFLTHHRWQGWDTDGALVFKNAHGAKITAKADATLLALGGGSWPKLGSDGSWVDILAAKGVAVTPLAPANCGFPYAWSSVFVQKYAGQPVKPLALAFAGKRVTGEMMVTVSGIEGGAVYALSAEIRRAIEEKGEARVLLDLRPGLDEAALRHKLSKPKGALSTANFLRRELGLSGVSYGLLRELAGPDMPRAETIKGLELVLRHPPEMARAISTAGGVARAALDSRLMIKSLPGVFAAGEMLDWEAPTGGYLLQATFASAVTAAQGIENWLKENKN